MAATAPAPASAIRRGPCSSRSSSGRGSSSSTGPWSTSPSRPSGENCRAALVGQLEGLTYITGGYLAVLAALLIPAGALSDAHGRRRVFGSGRSRSGRPRLPAGWLRPWSCSSSAGFSREPPGRSWCPARSRSSRPPSRARSGGARSASGQPRRRPHDPRPPGRRRPRPGTLVARRVPRQPAARRRRPARPARVPESRDEQATGGWTGLAIAGGDRRRRRPGFRADARPGAGWRDPVAFAALAIGAVALVAFPFLMAGGRTRWFPCGCFGGATSPP